MSNLAQNKKAYFNYEILSEFEAGIELLGHEVKSARNGGFAEVGVEINKIMC